MSSKGGSAKGTGELRETGTRLDRWTLSRDLVCDFPMKALSASNGMGSAGITDLRARPLAGALVRLKSFDLSYSRAKESLDVFSS